MTTICVIYKWLVEKHHLCVIQMVRAIGTLGGWGALAGKQGGALKRDAGIVFDACAPL